MTPLERYLRQRLQRKPLLLMTHVVVGYPSLDANLAMLEAMQRAEVDVVELQLPFSEPIADGPVFVRANQQALAAGMNWARYFQFMQRVSTAFDFKILMMGYYNSVLQMGHATFCAGLAAHGGSGFILADLPPEEALSGVGF
jgi:tryptophan synthase alpha chain